jgi:hypothetical protein
MGTVLAAVKEGLAGGSIDKPALAARADVGGAQHPSKETGLQQVVCCCTGHMCAALAARPACAAAPSPPLTVALGPSRFMKAAGASTDALRSHLQVAISMFVVR